MPMHQPYLPTEDTLVDTWTTVRWQPGSAMLLTNGANLPGQDPQCGLLSHGAHIMTPEHEKSTHYFYVAWRSWEQDNPDYGIAIEKAIYNAFSNEDKPMIEAQQSVLGDRSIEDTNLATLPIDAQAGWVRRIHQKLLAAEDAGEQVDRTGA